MIFATLPLREALGVTLAHSIKTEAQLFEKGRILTNADLATLAEAGIGMVVAARLEPGDIPEDEAARRIAAALTGPGLEAREAFTGRANIHAQAAGLLRLDASRLHRLNAIHEGLTVATRPDYAAVAPGQMIATVKIIPFALPEHVLNLALDTLDSSNPALKLAPFKPKRIALIATLLPRLKPSVIAKTRQVTEARIRALGATLIETREVAHRTEEIAAALRDARKAEAEIILVAGAAATGDRGDTVPAAIEMAGGEILHFGMPVDPGNLLVLARLGGVAVLGLPGCARSPKLNGVDLVLQRLVADFPVTSQEIMQMGVGGLLMDIPVRPQPRAGKSAGDARRIGAVLLAAGLSRRMGSNKLLSAFAGAPLIRRSAEILVQSGLAPIIVVTGHETEAIHAALDGLPVRFIHNPDYKKGLSSSLITGILAAEMEKVDAALIALGDMPLVKPEHIQRLAAAYAPEEDRLICVPVFEGKQGNPVLWSASLFDEMKQLTGDRGAKALLAAHAEEIAEIELGDPGVLVDIDTPEALARYRAEADE